MTQQSSTPLVLASTSPYRRALLEQAGVPFEVASPIFEEDHGLPLAPEDMVRAFAIGKAESLSKHFPTSLIIGSDQVAEIDGSVLTKPHRFERAVEQLMALAGKTHRLLTAVAVHSPETGQTFDELVVHQMRMRELTRPLAEGYVRADQPLSCAGSYKIESTGLLLFEEMRGVDHSGIIGLPLTAVARLVGRHGVDLLGSVLFSR